VCEVDGHNTTLGLIISTELYLIFKKLKNYLTHSAAINSFTSILIFRPGNTMLVDMFIVLVDMWIVLGQSSTPSFLVQKMSKYRLRQKCSMQEPKCVKKLGYHCIARKNERSGCP